MSSNEEQIKLMLRSEVDLLRARKEAERLAEEIGLNMIDSVKLTTAVSEIASNALVHGDEALISLGLRHEGKRTGVVVVVADKGPGILDVEAALRDGFSTRKSLGIGLGAAKRMMDDFELETAIGKGTTITMLKWKV